MRLHDSCGSEADLGVAAHDVTCAVHLHLACPLVVSGLVFGILLPPYRRHKLVVQRLLLVLDLCLALVPDAFNPLLM